MAAPLVQASADERLEARVTVEQKKLFREAATLQGVTLTDFITSSVHQAAIRALEARRVLELSRNDQVAFVKALLPPPAPNQRLRAAWSRYGSPDHRRRGKSRRARPHVIGRESCSPRFTFAR